jgi:8-oxo-dGTP diphosphatase
MRNIVNALLVREGAVLLARRSPGRTAYPSLWSFPGGHIETDETLDEALSRELREEVGVIPKRSVSLGSISDPNSAADDPATYHMYAITAWQGGEPAMVGDEHTELGWFAFAAAAAFPDLALEEYRPLFTRLAGGQIANYAP